MRQFCSSQASESPHPRFQMNSAPRPSVDAISTSLASVIPGWSEKISYKCQAMLLVMISSASSTSFPANGPLDGCEHENLSGNRSES